MTTKSKASPYEFSCYKCGVPVGKLVRDEKEETGAFFNVQHYNNWSVPEKGNTVCIECKGN
jgi:hypothetical protein